MKRQRDRKAQEESAKYDQGRTQSKSPTKISPSKSKSTAAAADADSGQILRGGPKTWPHEVVEHVQSLLGLGWSSSKVANHYSLVEFGLTSQQVDLVKSLPSFKQDFVPESSSPETLSPTLLEQVRKLILEGKTNTAIRNHYSLAGTNASEAQIQSVRTAVEKAAWRSTCEAQSISPGKRSATKIKPPQLSKEVEMHFSSNNLTHIGSG